MSIADKLNADKALIFRIVHRDNVPWILDHGLHARNGKECPAYRNIGNVDLIGRRATRIVPVPPGGTLNDYVPFYFTPYSIMMMNIVTGYNVPKMPREEIVILASSLKNVAKAGIPFVFTNQHALPDWADYYTDLADLKAIDWPLLQSRNFKNDPEDPQKKERYQAEALIWKQLPVSSLLGIGCYTIAVEQQLKAQIAARGLKLDTLVRPNWYL
ncbi:MAG: DUF4433 domain-containing protein [Burkholderiales bacterium]